jgi:hypothetical protein
MKMTRSRSAVAVTLALLATVLSGAAGADPLLAALQPYCGKAYAGTLQSNAPEDAAMRAQALIVHVADCRAGEVRMPFHVGADRSRTWVLRDLPQGLQLKHDHRHQDGQSDELTMYGGVQPGAATSSGASLQAQFPADDYSKLMFQALGRQAALQNVWSFELTPGKQLIYRLSRPGRVFAVAFDLTTPVPLPPPAWGVTGAGPKP